MVQSKKVKVLVAQGLCDPMDWGLPGSSVYGILQARILESVSLFTENARAEALEIAWGILADMGLSGFCRSWLGISRQLLTKNHLPADGYSSLLMALISSFILYGLFTGPRQRPKVSHNRPFFNFHLGGLGYIHEIPGLPVLSPRQGEWCVGKK